MDQIVDRTKKGGAEIVKYLEKGSAFYAPAASGVEMTESYLNDTKKELPCAAFLNGEYGVKNIYAGVPVKIGKNGVEEVVEIDLSENEKNQFGFVSASGMGNVPIKMGKEVIIFGKPLFAIRQNGRRSVTLRISSDHTKKDKPNAIEITFPQSRLTDDNSELSYRIDIFASPAQGSLFINDSKEQFGRLGGKIVFTSFGLDQGDKIEGRLETEAFRFLPSKDER